MRKSNLRQTVPFFMVTSMDESLDFYIRGLGFEIKIDWRPEGRIEWCWLERDGIALMLQEYRKDFLPKEKRGVGVSICFMCNDSLALYKEFLQSGLSPREPFVGNKLWVVELIDPDGYNICFESPTEVAEETSYAEWIRESKIE
ncbi:MAG TPA: VOC family protein [Chitinophagaceae bacterium]|nr:VOC family protein [Chitinophagaceae bacterium]